MGEDEVLEPPPKKKEGRKRGQSWERALSCAKKEVGIEATEEIGLGSKGKKCSKSSFFRRSLLGEREKNMGGGICAREKRVVIFKRKETLDSVDVSNCDNFGGEKMIGILFNLRGKILRRQCVPSHLFPARMVAKINKLRSLTASAFFFI